MKEVTIFKNRIIKHGTFDVNKIYAECKKWLSAHKYDNYTETEKTTKIKPQGIEIAYRGNDTRDITDYFRFKIDFAFLFEHLKEVQKNNKKMYKGKAEMRLFAILVLDYRNDWDKTKFSKFLHKVYKEHLIKAQIERVYGGKCYGEGMAFFQKMKETFECYTF